MGFERDTSKGKTGPEAWGTKGSVPNPWGELAWHTHNASEYRQPWTAIMETRNPGGSWIQIDT